MINKSNIQSKTPSRVTHICGSKKKGKVVPVLNLFKHYAMKAYGGVDV
jgi:hypothetical protein